MSVGYDGSGTLIQSGGTLTSYAFINIADQSSSSGTYTLSGGSVSTPYLAVAAGSSSSGTVIQSGGTATTTTDLYVGAGSGSTGFYSLSGSGTLDVNSIAYIGGTASGSGGTGTLAIGGGQANIGTLHVYNTTGTEVTMNGGSLSAGATDNLATISITGGTANLGPITGTGTLDVGDATASVTASGLQQSSVSISPNGVLNLTGGGATNAVKSLTISGNGILNLDTTRLLINYGSNPDPVEYIRGYLVFGYNGGNWNGPGIDSSAAAANHSYALGYADSADAGNPANLPTDTIEVRYTLYGDATLSGEVNSVDFGILASNFGKSGRVWDEGDFNYDGTVNSVDFGLLASNFGKSASGTDVQISAADWAALDAFAQANGLISEVPEPRMGVFTVLSAAGLTLRRRRRDWRIF